MPLRSKNLINRDTELQRLFTLGTAGVININDTQDYVNKNAGSPIYNEGSTYLLFSDKSIIPLVLANLMPILGVLFFNWDISALLTLYWMENFVIGFLNIKKMQLAVGDPKYDSGNLVINRQPAGNFPQIALIPFFIFHYGMFTLVHGVFVLAMFGLPKVPFYSLILSIISLYLSHSYSLKTNYIGKKEYLRVSSQRQMFNPYNRILVMHLTIVFGALFTQNFFGQKYFSDVMLVSIFVFFKIFTDVFFHKSLHQKFSLSSS